MLSPNRRRKPLATDNVGIQSFRLVDQPFNNAMALLEFRRMNGTDGPPKLYPVKARGWTKLFMRWVKPMS